VLTRTNLVSALVVLTLIISACGSILMGAPASQDMAEHVAWYYLRVSPPPEIPGGPGALLGSAGSLWSDRAGGIVGYVFEIQPIGYLVISADTRIVPLVAYSGTSDFPWEDDPENALLDVLLFDLPNRLEAAEEGLIPSARQNTQMWEDILAEPLSSSPFQLATYAVGYVNRHYAGTGRSIAFPNDWHQCAPYNDECPVCSAEAGTRCRVGCVALAMAQIIAHHKCPTDVVIPCGTSYKVKTGSETDDMTVDPDRQFGFTYPVNPTTSANSETVAALCAAAGLSVNTVYGSESSAAELKAAAAALAGAWRYRSADVIGFMPCPGVLSTVAKEVFSQKLRDEAQDGYPLLLSLSVAEARHAVVCDGWERETTDAAYVDRFHLRMGGVGTGTDSWYNLPEKLPAPYSVLAYGIFDIRPPADCTVAAYGLALRVDKGCGVRYDSGEAIEIIYSLESASVLDLFDFDPSSPGHPKLFPRGSQRAGGHSLSGTAVGTGVEVIIARAISGLTTEMVACRVPVNVSPSLLNAASLTTQKGCDASFSTGDRLVINYSVSLPVSNVWIFVVTAEGVRLMTSAPLKSSQGQITSANTIGPIKGDRILVLVATTAQGTVAATCKYTVP